MFVFFPHPRSKSHFSVFSSLFLALLCFVFHRLLCERNDVKANPRQFWLKTECAGNIRNRKDFVIVAIRLYLKYTTQQHRVSYHEKTRNRRSWWQVQVAFLISHTLQSGLDRKLRALGQESCLLMFISNDRRRRLFQTIVSSPTVDSDDTTLKEKE